MQASNAQDQEFLKRVIAYIRKQHRKKAFIVAGCVIVASAVIFAVILYVQYQDGRVETDRVRIQMEEQKALFALEDSMEASKEYLSAHKFLGTSGETVLVGQIASSYIPVEKFQPADEISEVMQNLNEVKREAGSHTMMSDQDYETLLAIVEAEAGGEDLKGKILVANVILNRVEDESFPDNVTDVVWQKAGNSVQFSPTADGRIHTVKVSDMTKEAVSLALTGTDYSEGALFFIEKQQADQTNVTWFAESLEYLFKHGGHSFYKRKE